MYAFCHKDLSKTVAKHLHDKGLVSGEVLALRHSPQPFHSINLALISRSAPCCSASVGSDVSDDHVGCRLPDVGPVGQHEYHACGSQPESGASDRYREANATWVGAHSFQSLDLRVCPCRPSIVRQIVHLWSLFCVHIVYFHPVALHCMQIN